MKKIFILLLIGNVVFFSCQDKLELYPHSAVAPGSITEKDLSALEMGMYLTVQNYPGTESWIINDLLGGTLNTGSSNSSDVINNILSPLSSIVGNSWNGYYLSLYQVNNVISITDALPSSDIRNRIKGTAHYFRALIYYYLVTHWGDVPVLPKNTLDLVKRDPASEAWTFIEDNLKTAISLLGTSTNYYYVSIDAAIALKARVKLSLKKYSEAADAARILIKLGKYKLDDFDKIFRKKDNTEIIFAFVNNTDESTIALGNLFYTYAHINKGSYTYRPNQSTFDMYESTDNRKAMSVDNSVGGLLVINKYPGGQASKDPFIVSRIAEMYLILAEAKGKDMGGADTLNLLRQKRGLTPVSPASDDAFTDAILLERKKEFLAEGFLYYDLIRTGKAESVLGLFPRQLLLPVPGEQLILNPNLNPQNPGY
jgi:starch-binding outer membrane protein, SusD/RagB family